MNDAHPRVHPLSSALINHAVIPAAIAVMHTSFENKRHRRKTSVRMWANAPMSGFYMFRHFDVSMMQQKERVNLFHLRCGQWLSNRETSHIHLFGVQQPGHCSVLH